MEKKEKRHRAVYIEIICAHCGKIFKRRESACKYSKTGCLFCSRACFYAWNYERLKKAGTEALKRYWRFRKHITNTLGIYFSSHIKQKLLATMAPKDVINKIWQEALRGVLYKGELLFPDFNGIAISKREHKCIYSKVKVSLNS